MKTFSAAAIASLALMNTVNGHYMFQKLTANGKQGSVYQNIRPVPNNTPVTSLSSNDLRCNVGGGSGSGTTTVSVAAGSSITFTADQAVYHQGPVSFYLTKVDSAASADGSTNWFKIKEIGPKFSPSATWDMRQSYDVTLPSCLAPGEYLARIEQLGIHNPGSPPQFYISCAQLQVTGSGSKTFSGVKIPGHVKSTDPGYTANIYQPDFKSYTVPGPAVSTC
jgi:hypothetical protein